ncbi:MAG: hypothetical protein AAF376_03820 [Pseudomonadota bacterium]
MTDQPKSPGSRDPYGSPERLASDYGEHLKDPSLTEHQRAVILSTLRDLLIMFADAGADVRPGQKLFKDSDMRFEDVVFSVCSADPSHETVAPPIIPNGEEQL